MSALTIRVLIACAGTGAIAACAAASSHREAPGITAMPKVDATDFYMFRSYEPGRAGFVTVIANYQPFQTPYGGPNFFTMDDDALYQIHFDNDADAREDITLTFRFNTINRNLFVPVGNLNVFVPLINIAPISAMDRSGQNVRETYTVDVTFHDGPSPRTIRLSDAQGARNFGKPVDHIGAKSIPDYEAYARSFIHDVDLPRADAPGRIFVGQRKDPFVVNLGEVFDLVNLNPVGPENGKADTLATNNITTIAVEVPISFLRQRRARVIGAWTTASLPRTRTLIDRPTFAVPNLSSGDFVQVSRLGMPLVNELVIGLRDKNLFNASHPRDDAQFANYVTNPSLPVLLNALFPTAFTPPCLPRNDLVQAFLTGVPGLNQPVGVRPAEMTRLNVEIAPRPKGQQSRLGALGADTSGFPNGRRPGDDVVDIELRVVAGALIADAACAPSRALPLTDGAFLDDSFFDEQFPYLRTPVSFSPNTLPVP